METGGSPTSGGVLGSGGTPTSGGQGETGGLGASGGNAVSGGTGATGGMDATGGADATGGMDASGGADTTGGTDATGGTETTPPPAAFDLDNPDRNKVTAGDVCDRLSVLQCAGEAYCCDSPGRTYEECYATTVDSCRNDAYLDFMTNDNSTGFDATIAEATLLVYETKALACDPAVASWGETVDGLRGIMQGTKADGTSCAPKALLSLPAAAASLAYCSDPNNVACMPNGTFTSWTCTARADIGGACITDLNCATGNYCIQDNPLEPVRSTCAARKANDEACGFNNECQSLACKAGVCVEATAQAAYCLQ